MREKGFSKDFLLVAAGQIISLFGNGILRFALPVRLLDMTGSAKLLGIVSGLAFLPLALLSPVGGLIADRVNKRNIMVCLDFFTGFLCLVFILLYVPCVAAVSTLYREMNSLKWTVRSILWQLCAAWLVSFVVFQVGSLLF